MSSFAAFSPGWLSTGPEEKEKCQECGCLCPSAADLLAGHSGARGSSLVLAPGWDSANYCCSGEPKLRCMRLADAFGHVDDLIHAYALIRAWAGIRNV